MSRADPRSLPVGDIPLFSLGEGKEKIEVTVKDFVEAADEVSREEYVKIGLPAGCPVPLDFAGKKLCKKIFEKQFRRGQMVARGREMKQNVDSRAFEEGRQLWALEQREGGLGRRVDEHILDLMMKSTGLSTAYQAISSQDENVGMFEVKFRNAFATNVPVWYGDGEGKGKFIPIFSCFHACVKVGQHAGRITEGEWDWHLIEPDWVKEGLDKIYSNDECKVPPDLLDLIDRSQLLVDTYTAVLIGSFSGAPMKRKAIKMHCDPAQGGIVSLDILFEYRKSDLEALIGALGIITDNVRNFDEENSEIVKMIYREMEEDLQVSKTKAGEGEVKEEKENGEEAKKEKIEK